MQLQDFIGRCQQRIEAVLDNALAVSELGNSRLTQAMRYSCINGGKRLRPVLVYAVAETLNIPLQQVDDAACAVEMVHAYSLIHDDLPAMDDDALRRGRPTCHIQFDEATAILAGDALQSLAFSTLLQPTASHLTANRMQMARLLADASYRMVVGQAIDLESTNRSISLEQLTEMHLNKTGALIRASILMAAYSDGQIEPEIEKALDQFAYHIGLAFQIRDDILDVQGDTQLMGKQAGADLALAKSTYTSLLGLQPAIAASDERLQAALTALQPLAPKHTRLTELARYIIERNH